LNTTYFRNKSGYLGVTKQSPAGMKGLIFIGRGPQEGGGIESVCEQGYPLDSLKRMERVKAADVPDDWFAAIGLEKPEPKPEPTPMPTPPPRPVVIDLTLPCLTTASDKRHPEFDRFSQQWMIVTLLIALLLWVYTKLAP